jgi:hypothetical protein
VQSCTNPTALEINSAHKISPFPALIPSLTFAICTSFVVHYSAPNGEIDNNYSVKRITIIVLEKE